MVDNDNACDREKGERSELRTNFMLISGIILVLQIISGCILGCFRVQVTHLYNDMTYANEGWFLLLMLGQGIDSTSSIGKFMSKLKFGGKQ